MSKQKFKKIYLILLCSLVFTTIINYNSILEKQQELFPEDNFGKIHVINFNDPEEQNTKGTLAPTLMSPTSGTLTDDDTPTFVWSSVSGTLVYHIDIATSSSFGSSIVLSDTTGSVSYTPSSGLDDDVYYWHVASEDFMGLGPASSTWNFEIDTTPPEAVSLASPPNGYHTNDTTPTLDWDWNDDTDYYQLQLANTEFFITPTTYTTSNSQYTLPTYSEGTHWWRVRSVDEVGHNGAWSTKWSFIIDTTAPGTPTLVSPSNYATITEDEPTLDWSDASGAHHYQIYFQRGTNTPIILTATSSEYTFSASQTDGTFYWKVRAVDAAGNCGSYSTGRQFTIDTTGPGTPTLTSPINNLITNDTTQTFSWSSVGDANYYHFQLSEETDFSSTVYDTYHSGTSTSPTALDEGVYYWHVQARDPYGNWGTYCAYRTITIDTSAPGIPTPMSPDDDSVLGSLSFTLQWSLPSGADHYQILVADNIGFSSASVYSTSSLSYLLSLSTADTYYWCVRGVDEAGNCGDYSTVYEFIVDLIDPTISSITHTPNPTDDTDSVTVSCTVTDTNGIACVTLYYRVDSGSWTATNMTNPVDDDWERTIGSFSYDETIEYYIVAKDNASPANVETDDNSGSYYSFTIVASDTTGPVISSIIHSPSSPTDVDSVTISCTATDDNDVDSVTLYYRIVGSSWVSISMTNTIDDTYSVDIGPFDYTEEIEFYITATDAYVVPNTRTDDNSGSYYSFTVIVSDTTGPSITVVEHSPSSPTDTDEVTISCTITDSQNNVDSATLWYRIDGGAWTSVSMSNTFGNTWSANIGPFTNDEVIEYYIEAVDDYVVPNTSTNDNGGSYYSFTVGVSDTTGPAITTITHSPSSPTDLDTITISCVVSDANGVASVTLYYRVDGGSWVSVSMINNLDDTYYADIGSFSYDELIEFYIEAVDGYVVPNTSTNDNSGSYYDFTIGASDVTGPTITGTTHNPITPTDLEDVTFSCTVTDENGVLSVYLYYRINGGSWVHIAMTNTADDTYEVTLGAFDYNDYIEYYIYATDDYVTQNTNADANGGTYYDFTAVSGDVTGPSISDVKQSPETPIETSQVVINCTVTDAAGISSVTLYYRINDGAWTSVAMSLASGSVYEYEFASGFFETLDEVEYYIVAVDASPNDNEATNENSGSYFSFTIYHEDFTSPEIDSVSHTPTSPTENDSVTISCVVVDSNGLASVTLYYRIDGGSWISTSMVAISSFTYSVDIGIFNPGETIDYYIVAVDDTPNCNTATADNDGSYYNFTIEEQTPTPTPTSETPTTSEGTLLAILPIFALLGLVLVRRKKN